MNVGNFNTVASVSSAAALANLGRSNSQPYVIPRKLSSSTSNPLSGGQSPMLDPGSNKFIIPDISVEANTFEVEIKRNGLGLGFSITGGAYK